MPSPKIKKGKEYRPRLHEGSADVEVTGKFIILKMNSKEAAEEWARKARKFGVFLKRHNHRTPEKVI